MEDIDGCRQSAPRPGRHARQSVWAFDKSQFYRNPRNERDGKELRKFVVDGVQGGSEAPFKSNSSIRNDT